MPVTHIHRVAKLGQRRPDIEIVLRPCFTAQDIDDRQLDLAVLAGWPPDRDFVVKPLAQTRLVVCASPDYWARAGEPRDPDYLRDHDCLIVRSSGGTLVDRWIFARDDERRTVDVKVRVVGDDLAWIGEAAAAGVGVLRVIDLTLPAYASTGRLVPALTDWESLEAPMIFAAYPPAQRRSRLVRVFLDFLIEVFEEIERERTAALGGSIPRAPRPEWFGRTHGRQSAFGGRGRTCG